MSRLASCSACRSSLELCREWLTAVRSQLPPLGALETATLASGRLDTAACAAPPRSGLSGWCGRRRPQSEDPEGQDRSQAGQREQEPGGDRVELPHVSEGERAQERPERRRAVRLREEPAHPAVVQQSKHRDRLADDTMRFDSRNATDVRVRV